MTSKELKIIKGTQGGYRHRRSSRREDEPDWRGIG